MSTARIRSGIAGSIKYLFPTLWIEVGLRWWKGHFEPELFLMPVLCNKNQIAIDVGANQGIYSYYMAKFARKVVAFEPNPDLISVLKRVVNQSVTLQYTALSDVQGRATMRVDPTNHGLSTIEQKNSFQNAATEAVQRDVPTRTLDSFDFTNVSFIKIDVEGHEEAVLRGARETIIRCKPVLIVESEDQHNDGAPRRVSDMLEKLGYRGFFVRDGGLCDLDDLKPGEADPKNYAQKKRYVNNFIFVPANDEPKISQIKNAAAALQRNAPIP